MRTNGISEAKEISWTSITFQKYWTTIFNKYEHMNSNDDGICTSSYNNQTLLIAMWLRPCQLTEIWIGWDIVWLEGECILLLLSSTTVERVMVIVKLMIAQISSNLEI
jgi:hypothetical protein